MCETVTVLGVDSLLGGAVAKALTRKFKVKGVTLGSGLGGKEEGLRACGVEVIDGQVCQLETVLTVSQGCFVTLQTDLARPDCYQKDIQLGRAIADACKAAKVAHVILDSKLSPGKITGVSVRHMDSKAETESYMKSLDLPLTCIICPLFYQQLLFPPLRPSRIDNFSFSLQLPTGNSCLDWISADDVGTAVTEMFHQGSALYGKTFNLSGDKVTLKELAAILSTALMPRLFIDKMLTVEQYGKLGFHGSNDLAFMFDFYVRVDQRASRDATRRFCPELQTLDDWLQQNAQAISSQIDCA